jgi:hypothetical protein
MCLFTWFLTSYIALAANSKLHQVLPPCPTYSEAPVGSGVRRVCERCCTGWWARTHVWAARLLQGGACSQPATRCAHVFTCMTAAIREAIWAWYGSWGPAEPGIYLRKEASECKDMLHACGTWLQSLSGCNHHHSKVGSAVSQPHQ